MLEFKIGEDSAGAAIKNLARQLSKEYPRAMAAGINRTAKVAQTVAVREIQKDTGASSQKTIRRHISVFYATAEKLIGGVRAVGTKKDKIPIYELSPSPKSVTRRRPAGGVKWGPTKTLIPGSFIARMKSGHVGVFSRIGDKRLPIREDHGPSVAWVFGNRKIRAALKKVVDERLNKEIDRAFKFFTSK